MSNTPSSAPTSIVIYSKDLLGVKPQTFDWDSDNLPQTFRSFKRYCELLFSTPTYVQKKGKGIVNYILLWMGPAALELFDNWSHLSEEQKKNPNSVWQSFVAD